MFDQRRLVVIFGGITVLIRCFIDRILTMCDLIHDAPFKIMIKDLKGLSKCEKSWIYDFNVGSMYKTKLNKFHIQGEIIKTAGFMKEIFIIFDGTAKAKVTKGPHVPGDLSWINEGKSYSQFISFF